MYGLLLCADRKMDPPFLRAAKIADRKVVMEKVSPGIGLEARIAALAQLGDLMALLGNNDPWPGLSSGVTRQEFDRLNEVIVRARQFNGWYTEENVRYAFRCWGSALRAPEVKRWVDRYPLLGEKRIAKKVGLILAGNVPLVGLHDVISTWLSGNYAIVRTSSQEPELIPALIGILNEFVPGTSDRIISVKERLGDVDAVIATGSNNTARYFEHYFGHLPRIVRKSRVSVAIMDGSETKAEIEALGEDVFRYFGLGCRNVSKLFLPKDFDLDRIFEGFFNYKDVIQHNKYANNYDYTRALWLLDRVPFFENGFVLLKEDAALASPVSTVFHERYADRNELERKLKENENSIQCIVGHGHVPFGKAQKPSLTEYADRIDTIEFLIGLDHSPGQNS